MVMSSKQRDDLNWAIIDYLESHGFSQTSATLRKEANIDENADPNKLAQVSGLLEKKWTLTTRLQQKVLTLEEKLQQMDREALSGAPTRDKRQPDEWIPRPPERYQLNGHRLPVTKVIFHPVFNVIASCSEDCTVKIWDFESGEFERSIKGHTDAVQDINFNASGKLLVSCSADMSIKIWDFVNSYESNGYCVQNFVGHTDWVRMVRVNGTGSHFASCSNDKTIKVWSMDKQNANSKPKTLVGHDHVVESIFWVPDAFTASIVGADAPKESKMNGDVETPSVLISASRDRSIRFWDVLNCTCLFVLLGHDNWVRSVRVHPGGKYLISVGDDKTMRIWSMEHKRCIKVLQAHNQFVTSIDFHYKLPYVVTSSVDTTIKVWECR
ncbi:WD domain, g-beta repeat domain-containing protein [Ditylenchus destructor]|uniref:WD domain, g-beta repeat domain-containing protein n=1 Tax=Ditylenchus destructor TaxID=166010 RepID=A0AAD4NFA9_9BILA|nr:WD domain, g-beta repeat domain-containing protein [Ditylenchus destructor]